MCKNCGLIFRLPDPSDDLASSGHYGCEAPTHTHLVKSLRRGLAIAEWINASVEAGGLEMKLGPNARVLDIGSGTGGVLAIFRQLYHCETYGVEPDVGFSRYANDWMGVRTLNAPFQQADPSGPLQLIIVPHAIFCFPRPDDVLRRLVSLLADGGVLYISVGDYLRPRRLEGLGNYLLKDYARYYFTRSSMARLLATTGFKLLQVDRSVRGEMQFLAISSADSPLSPLPHENWIRVVCLLRFYDLRSFGNRAARRILRSVRSLIRLRARS